MTLLAMILAGCASPPPAVAVAVTAVARHPEAYFGRAVVLCGDLGEAYVGGFDRATPGFPLYSPAGESSRMHGRVGVFVPRRAWLDAHVGTAVCVTGTVAHASGMTPAEVARQTAQYYTSSAVDDQWWFDATGAAADRSRPARPARFSSPGG